MIPKCFFTRTIYDNMHYEATGDDPGACTKPFTIGWDIRWVLGGEIEEYVCQENNKVPGALRKYSNRGSGFRPAEQKAAAQTLKEDF